MFTVMYCGVTFMVTPQEVRTSQGPETRVTIRSTRGQEAVLQQPLTSARQLVEEWKAGGGRLSSR